MNKSLKKSVALSVIVCLLATMFTFLNVQEVNAATSVYSLGTPSYKFIGTPPETFTGRAKIGSKYFHVTFNKDFTNAKLYCCATRTGNPKMLHELKNAVLDGFSENILSNGTYAIYGVNKITNVGVDTIFYKTKLSTGSKTKLFTITELDNNLNATHYAAPVAVYNNKLYYINGNFQLYSYSFKTKKKTRVATSFDFKDANGHGRYIYGIAKYGTRDIKVFDCEKNKVIKTLTGVNNMFSLRGSKIYYVKNQNVYSNNMLGTSQKLVLKNPLRSEDDSLYIITSNKVYFDRYDKQAKKYKYYYYNMSTKSTVQLKNIKTPGDWFRYLDAEMAKTGTYYFY